MGITAAQIEYKDLIFYIFLLRIIHISKIQNQTYFESGFRHLKSCHRFNFESYDEEMKTLKNVIKIECKNKSEKIIYAACKKSVHLYVSWLPIAVEIGTSTSIVIIFIHCIK